MYYALDLISHQTFQQRSGQTVTHKDHWEIYINFKYPTEQSTFYERVNNVVLRLK